MTREMSDLFGRRPEDRHDPGGKVRLRLSGEVRGGARFSECGRYRPVLWRTWGADDAPYALWIGMNPSTATAEVDDPTIRRETVFTQREGLVRYVKCNVMDYRATSPKDLLKPGVVPCSPENLPEIALQASGAALVVLAYGAAPKPLRGHGEAVSAMLRKMGIKVMCLGLTNEGLPRHPLYVRGDAPLIAV